MYSSHHVAANSTYPFKTGHNRTPLNRFTTHKTQPYNIMTKNIRNIIGLDLGTNSIGWSWIQQLISPTPTQPSEYLFNGTPIIRMSGSRIIPMPGDVTGSFERGETISKTKDRTAKRMARRMNERFQLRRERLNRVLNIMGFLPEHYARALDRYGKLNEESNTTIAWRSKEDGKNEFIFYPSFLEMASIFKERHPDIQRIPLDWTLYYLRSKALHQAITKEELSWVLHSFNQKRGYYQPRKDITEKEKTKKIEYIKDIVRSVEDTGEKTKGKKAYKVTFDNGFKFISTEAEAPLWVGRTREVIVTTSLDATGAPKRDKEGDIIQSVKAPEEKDWTLKKIRTENLIDKSKLTVGEYILQTLLEKPDTKIKGAHVSTIDRRFYIHEINAILKVQEKYHKELRDKSLYEQCTQALYTQNEVRRNIIAPWSMSDLLIKDILFYHRPLKSKKSQISECPFEFHNYTDKNGASHRQGIKCIPTSHPLFQEYRIWQFIANLRIYERERFDNGKHLINENKTSEFLTSEKKEELFEWLVEKDSVSQKTLLGHIGLKVEHYHWNFPEEKTYPCGETRHLIQSRLKKANLLKSFCSLVPEKQKKEFELKLWHILYSVSDYNELRKALETFARKTGFTREEQDLFVEFFSSCPPFKKVYGAYSKRAIARLLPLMRLGKYWHEEHIDSATMNRIEHLISGEECNGIDVRVRESIAKFGLNESIEQYQGLPQWLACYVVYNRHSEASEVTKWESPEELDNYIKAFKQYSLRNLIVEQISLETLRVVHDLWAEIQKEGQTIDEIHLEMGRDLKNTAEERARISKRNSENEDTNFRIKLLLKEFYTNEEDMEGIRPYSPSQQELLRIYEEGVWQQEKEIPQDIKDIKKKLSSDKDINEITHSDVQRYRIWMDQKYCSPYTGNPIPLSRLFTPDYEIEHVIPRSRYFDDSYNNKVICEAAVNKDKNNRLGMEYIMEAGGKTIELGNGKNVQVLKEREYVELVNEVFKNNTRKRNILLADEIPEDFSHRQLNDTRYIARFMKGILSNIVREKNADGTLELEETSKNLIVCSGRITDRIKQDWGLNDVWNHIITPRFERLNQKTSSDNFGEYVCKEGKRYFQTRVPLNLQKGFNKKRIDHRHHAMDAIAIACVNRSIVNYLNNAAANQTEREDLRRAVCIPERNGQTKRQLRSPWRNFAKDAENALRQIVVSFKQNLRILTKATNSYECFDTTSGKKIRRHQVNEEHYAVRKPLHEDFVYGEVILSSIASVNLKKALQKANRILDKHLKDKIFELRKLYSYSNKQIEEHLTKVCINTPEWKDYDFKKINIRILSNDEGATHIVAIRKPLDESFDKVKINTITDTGIQKILLNHLSRYAEDPKKAFSLEGIEDMNANITSLNGGKQHLPIYKVRVSEKDNGGYYPIGQKGNRSKKNVTTAKDTNLFFAVYADSNGKRSFKTIDLRTAIECKKQGLSVAPSVNEKGEQLLFTLSPNDLVYMPSEEEEANGFAIDNNLNKEHIYKMVSTDSNRCFFIPHTVANFISRGEEYNRHNKIELTEDRRSIKEHCVPLKVNRLGKKTL